MKNLKTKIWNKFLRNKASTKFDELNVIKSSKSLYSDLNKMNKQTFLQIARDSYKQISDKDIPNLAWVLAILLAYNEVIQYVYAHEVDRKRARFAESVIASGNQITTYKRAYNSWIFQTQHFADTVEREATIKAYKDNGVKKLVWVTKLDGNECKICRERHMKVYDIDKVPSITHVHCRCELKQYEGE